MSQQIIKKIDEFTFQSEWSDVQDSTLVLSFKPIIDHFRLKIRPISFLHWQAKPKGFRRFGLFTTNFISSTGEDLGTSYLPLDFCQLELKVGECSVLQIPEQAYTTVPTAVMYYPRSFVRFTNTYYELTNGTL